VHGYDCGGIGRACSVSSWAQASVSSGLLAAMCHERFDPQKHTGAQSCGTPVQRWLLSVSIKAASLPPSQPLRAYPMPKSPIAAVSGAFWTSSAPRLVTTDASWCNSAMVPHVSFVRFYASTLAVVSSFTVWTAVYVGVSCLSVRMKSPCATPTRIKSK